MHHRCLRWTTRHHGGLKLATSDDGGVGRSTSELGRIKFPNGPDFRGSAQGCPEKIASDTIRKRESQLRSPLSPPLPPPPHANEKNITLPDEKITLPDEKITLPDVAPYKKKLLPLQHFFAGTLTHPPPPLPDGA